MNIIIISQFTYVDTSTFFHAINEKEKEFQKIGEGWREKNWKIAK